MHKTTLAVISANPENPKTEFAFVFFRFCLHWLRSLPLVRPMTVNHPRLTIDNLESHIDDQIARSRWFSVSQQEVDAFANITGDRDPMHVDPEWAASNSPYTRTVLAGFNILSLLPRMARESGLQIEGASLVMNYGFDRIRFVAPVPVGTRFRNTIAIKAVERRPDGTIKLTTSNAIEVEGSDKPATTADWINLIWP